VPTAASRTLDAFVSSRWPRSAGIAGRHRLDQPVAITGMRSNSKVRVLMVNVIPNEGFKQTITGRRKRFREALSQKSAGTGGREGDALNTYERDE